MAESVLRIVIDSRNAERNARNVANELQNIERNGDHASRSMDSMSVATRSLVGYMGGLVTIGAAISKMDAYTGLQNRLKLVTDSQAELNTAMNDTFGIAQKTASSWDSVAMVYQRFADNADRLNITMAQTSALTETVSKAISVSGGSAASAEAALMQFGQALASGVLRGEEFNSIAEQAPGLLKAIAFGLDTNVGSLRAMAAEGQITGDVLVKSLSKAQPYIDDLFNKTDFTISQSFTKLTNEITKFVGEAGTGSGAAKALSGAIDSLASNLSTIADIAVVGGVAMLTKTILAQTVAIQGSITASVARRAADTAVLQSQVQLAVVEAQRTRNKVGELAAEQNLIVAKLRTNLATKERIALEARATQVAIQLAVAERNMTAATAQRTIAQNTLNASMSAGSRILGLVGGPIGAITLGVAGLAAGYMYLKNRTAEANAKLEEQGKVAEKTNEELTKLSGNDKKNAVSDLTAAFNAQNAELSKSKEAVDAVLFAIRASSVENEKARKVTEDAKNGVISYNQAIELLNKMDISPELYEMLKKQVIQYDENAVKAGKSQRALGLLGEVVKLAGNLFQNSALQVNQSTDALDDNARAANAATKAHQDYLSKAQSQAANDIYTTGLINQGRSPAQAKAIVDLQNAKGVSAILTKEEIDQALRNLALTDANAAAEKKYADRISNRSKAQSDAARKAKQAQEQARREAEQLRKEQFDLREQYTFDYADREKQIELDLAREIADIRKANFANPEPYLEAANKRAYYEKQIYLSQLQFEINEFQMSEEQKLKYSYDIKSLQLEQNSEITKESKEIAIKALGEQYQQELGYIKLAQETQLFQAKQAYMHEVDAMQERYRLERMEIAKIKDEKQRAGLLNASYRAEDNEYETKRKNAWDNYRGMQAERDGTGEFLQLDFAKENASKTIEDSVKHNLITEQQAKIDLLKVEEDYQKAKLQLTLSYGERIAGSVTDSMATIFGEQSGAYNAMFAVQKGFAIAQSMIAIQQGIANAMSLPFPTNLAAVAIVAAETASILSNIKSVTMTVAGGESKGYKSGGYTGNYGVNQEAGVVHGQEYVLNAAATKRVGVGTLDAINSGKSLGGNVVVQPQITINVPQGFTAEKSEDSSGAVTIDIVRKEINQGVKRGFSNLNNPNSFEAKQIQRNTTAGVKR